MIFFGKGDPDNPSLPDETQLLVIAELIYSSDFPQSIVSFSRTSQHGMVIARDWQLWRHALHVYFPFTHTLTLEHTPYQSSINDPYQLFKNIYTYTKAILQTHHLHFSDYVKFLLNKTCTLPVDKVAILNGLAIAAGQKIVLASADVQQAKEFALVFCAALGNKNTFIQLLSEAPSPSSEAKRCAFIIATENGFLPLSVYLISHAHAQLDRNTICDAFLRACSQGHARIVQVFLTQPVARVLSFCLPRALSLACMHGHIDVVAELIKNTYLKTNARALRDAFHTVVDYQQEPILQKLMHAFRLPKNLSVVELLRKCILKRNASMLAMILSHQDASMPLTAILDLVEEAMHSQDEKIVKVIIESKFNLIMPYARRKMLYQAAEKGMMHVVLFLLEQDSKTFSRENIGQAARLAAANHHHVLLAALLEKANGNIPEADKKYISQMSCAQPSQAVTDSEVSVQITSVIDELNRLTLEERMPTEDQHSLLLPQFGSVKKTVMAIEKRLVPDASAAPKGAIHVKFL